MGPPLSLSPLIGCGDTPTQTWEPVPASNPYTLPLLEPMSTVLLTTTGAVTSCPSPVKVHVCTRSLRRVDETVPALSAITAVLVTAGALADAI